MIQRKKYSSEPRSMLSLQSIAMMFAFFISFFLMILFFHFLLVEHGKGEPSSGKQFVNNILKKSTESLEFIEVGIFE